MKIAVCGLGHVGSATAACLLEDGHSVLCYDTDKSVVDLLQRGASPVSEPGISERLFQGHLSGALHALDRLPTLDNMELVLVCVGTEGRSDGTLETDHLREVALSIGLAIRHRPAQLRSLPVVVRSTVLPGTMANVFIPAVMDASGEGPGGRYEVVYHPEFIREGSALADYRSPSRIVVGGPKGSAATLVELYRDIDAPIIETSFELAEMAKLVDNTFHALKATFANELGRFALAEGLDRSALFEIFVADRRLNISEAYLRPGGAFGGPCLRKDVSALASLIKQRGGSAPLIDSILPSNENHTEFLLDEIVRRVPPGGRILLVGLTFKAGSDDLRGSPSRTLAQQLVHQGFELRIFDPDLRHSSNSDLSDQLRERVIERGSTREPWDLVVVCKSGVLAPSELPVGVAVFTIDRL